MMLKQPTTFLQQEQLLSSRGVIILDSTSCQQLLKNVNYYRLSAYLLPFKNSSGNYSNVSIEQLEQIYEFDQQLRNLIFSAIEDIEVYLRTQLSYYHAHNYGAEGYMDKNNYNGRHDHTSFEKKVKNCIQENSKTLVVLHHNKKYGGHFPIWVISEFFSMGMLSYFYRGMKRKDKKKLAKQLFGVNDKVLDSWFRCITDLRNKCAHYSRMYYWVFSATPAMPIGVKYIPTRRLFAQLYMLKLMYPDKDKWNSDFVKPLSKLIKRYNHYISKSHLDFPYRWKSMLTS